MVGKVNLYVPGEDEFAAPATNAYNKINGKVKLAGAFKYANEKEAVRFATSSASAGETAIVAVDSGRFNDIKLLLLKVLSVKVLSSPEIIQKIGTSLPADSNEYKINTAIAEGSAVFVSENGLRSAFSCRCGKGIIILLPLEAKELDCALNAGALSDTAPKKTSVDKLTENLTAIAKSGKRFAAPAFGLSRAIDNVVKNSDVQGINFTLTNKVPGEEEGDEEEKDFIANAAKSVIEKGRYDFGAAISDIAEDGTVSVCVADENSAKVEVIHPVPGEDRSQLAKAATLKVIEMMAYASEKGIHPPKHKKNNNNIKPLIIIIICLAVAAAACLTVGAIIFRKDIRGRETDKAQPVTIGNIQTISDAEDDEDELGEVIPDFAVQESTTEDISALEESLLAIIGTTFKGNANDSAAANGQFTTNAGDIMGDILTSTAATTLALATGTEPVTDENGETVTVPSTEATTAAVPSGYFEFTVYGYGHGVGMSQRGAIALARQGKNCNQILTNYYQNVTIMVDRNTPQTVTRRGVEMSLVAFLCRTVKKEIGSGSPIEAQKAQAIAAYTYAMCNDFNSRQAFDPSFDYKGTQVEQAVFEVLHITSEDQVPHATYVSYNGGYANTVYFASSAGKTTSARSVWGSSVYDSYLRGGRTSPEEVEITTVKISTDTMKKYIENYTGKPVNSDPAAWIHILSHDGAYSNSVGYVDKIDVNGTVISGNTFRSSVLGNQIKSHCFTIKLYRYR